jgi:outer membrane receptor protein involved in Fe transport
MTGCRRGHASRRWRARCALFLILCWLAPARALAQSEAGSATLAGTIVDASGAVVAGAKVRVTSLEQGWSREVESTQAGQFTAVRLAPGAYTVSVSKDGFKTLRRDRIELGVGADATIALTLEAGEVLEEVTVAAAAPIVETGRAETSTRIDERAVRNLPTNGRNFLDFTVLSPGVVRDPRAGDLSFGGQRGPANSLLVDGVDANSAFWGQSAGRTGFRNPYSFSQDAVQEFQVHTNAFAAEIGRATGGVINVITKSGTNDLRGTAFWFYRDRALNANTFFNNRAGLPKAPYHFNQFGGNLGGPLRRDALFFFYNYDGQRNTAPNSVFFPLAVPADAASQQAARELAPSLAPYETGLRNDIHTVKVDWTGSGRHMVSVRYNRHRFLGTNFENPGNQSSRDHTGDSTIDTDSVAATHTWVLGPSVVVDQRATFLREANPSGVNGEGPEVIVRQGGTTMITFGRANFLPRFTDQRKYALVQTVTWSRGRHTFKAGHDFKFERAEQLNTNLFGGQYVFNSLADFANRRPASYAQSLPTAGTSGGTTWPDADEYAAFAQDSWRLTDRLTLHYGARYDLFLYQGNGIRNPDPALASPTLTSGALATGVMPRDKNDVAGRVGFAYRPDPARALVLRGGAGTFYGALPGLVARTIQAQNGVQVQSFTLTGAAVPAYPTVLTDAPSARGAAPDLFVMQPDFRTPLTHQWSLNVEGQIARGTALTLGYLGTRGLDLTRVRDINQLPYDTIDARFADGTPVTVLRRPGATAPARPNPAFGRISVVESSARSLYHAGFVQLSTRLSDVLQVQASYTFSKVIDTAPEATAFIPNSAAEDPKLVQDTLNPDADRGVGDSNVAHRFVLSGIWDIGGSRGGALAGGWQLSTIVTLQSGRWYSVRSNVDLDNDGNRFTDRAPGYGRNTIEGPGYATLDARLSKRVPLGRGADLRLMVEAFNALNRSNVSAVQQVLFTYDAASRLFTPNPAFGTATNTSDPRILQLAARVTF